MKTLITSLLLLLTMVSFSFADAYRPDTVPVWEYKGIDYVRYQDYEHLYREYNLSVYSRIPDEHITKPEKLPSIQIDINDDGNKFFKVKMVEAKHYDMIYKRYYENFKKRNSEKFNIPKDRFVSMKVDNIDSSQKVIGEVWWQGEGVYIQKDDGVYLLKSYPVKETPTSHYVAFGFAMIATYFIFHMLPIIIIIVVVVLIIYAIVRKC